MRARITAANNSHALRFIVNALDGARGFPKCEISTCSELHNNHTSERYLAVARGIGEWTNCNYACEFDYSICFVTKCISNVVQT